MKPNLDQEAEEADLILATGDICGDSADVRDAMFASKGNDRDWWSILGRQKAEYRVVKSLEEGVETFLIILIELISRFLLFRVLPFAGHIHKGYGHEHVLEALAANAGLESNVMVKLGDGKIENIGFSLELDD